MSKSTPEFRVCQDCGLPYAVYETDPTRQSPRCPRCADIRQHRPSVCQERERLAEWVVEIESLPDVWRSFQSSSKDEPCYKIDLRGKRFGTKWDGRVVIYAKQPFAIGDNVFLRLMRATHQVRADYKSHLRMDFTETTIREKYPIWKTEFGEVETETREYLVMESIEVEPTAKLIWREARTKTTLKGLGRQYISQIVVDPEPVWSKTVTGGYRSGRAHTDAMLAIVDTDAKIQVITFDNI
jgi:hypothetical protein